MAYFLSSLVTNLFVFVVGLFKSQQSNRPLPKLFSFSLANLSSQFLINLNNCITPLFLHNLHYDVIIYNYNEDIMKIQLSINHLTIT